MQQRLVDGRYYTSGIDGDFGAGTRRAITAWQRTNGYGQTGYLNRTQLTALTGRPRPAPIPRRPLPLLATARPRPPGPNSYRSYSFSGKVCRNQ